MWGGQIVRQLDALRYETQKLEVVYQKKLYDLEELKKSVLPKAFVKEVCGGDFIEPETEKSRRDEMIIAKNIPPIIKPRRGDIYSTPSGLGNRNNSIFYNPITPSGLNL